MRSAEICNAGSRRTATRFDLLRNRQASRDANCKQKRVPAPGTRILTQFYCFEVLDAKFLDPKRIWCGEKTHVDSV